MSKRKAKARLDAAAEELAVGIEQSHQVNIIKETPSNALFSLDTTGSKSQHKRKVVKRLTDISDGRMSITEQKLVQKIITGKKPMPKAKRIQPKPSIYDAWADDDTSALSTVNDKNPSNSAVVVKEPASKKRRIGGNVVNRAAHVVPLPGQSYNPSGEDYQDAVAEAVALELKREEIRKEKEAPISKGLTEFTMSLLIGDNDGSSSSDEEEEDVDMSNVDIRKKHPERKTRAERNKQKRKVETETQQKLKKSGKEMAQQLESLKSIRRSIEDEESRRSEVKASRKRLRETALPRPDAEVLNCMSIPVNLTSELRGSLRAMKAQGSVLRETVKDLKRLKMHPDPEKAIETLKGGGNKRGHKRKHKFLQRYRDAPENTKKSK